MFGRLRVLEKEKAQDGNYILKQDQEIEKLLENKLNNVSLIKVQEEQIANLKSMLGQVLNVKVKYENIIKRLLDN